MYVESDAKLSEVASKEAIASEIQSRIAALQERSTSSLRNLRRNISLELGALPGADVLRIVEILVSAGSPCPRWFAYEIAHHHENAMSRLSVAWLRRLGRGLSEWGQVDPFGCYLLGPAWREGSVSDREVKAWARSKDRWRRRSALVSTVALNCAARGGSGDPKRTLAICSLLLKDRDEMVVKALSWALRELAVREPALVDRYMTSNEHLIAARVVREVRNKLKFGLKNPKRSPRALRGQQSSKDADH
jgi:hypothetical protein